MTKLRKETYHGRTTNSSLLTIRKFNSSFTSHHTSAVGSHGDADKREAVVVPGHCRRLVAVGNDFSGILVINRDVNVSNLVVECGDKLDTSSLRDPSENLRGPPSLVGEWGALVAHATDHVGVEVRLEAAVTEHGLAEDLAANLEDGFVREEREGIRNGHGGDAMALKTNVLHKMLDNLGLGCDMLFRVPWLSMNDASFVDNLLRDGGSWAHSPLLLGSNDMGSLEGRGSEAVYEARHISIDWAKNQCTKC